MKILCVTVTELSNPIVESQIFIPPKEGNHQKSLSPEHSKATERMGRFFGSVDSVTGEWQINPSPTVTYGNNGFFEIQFIIPKKMLVRILGEISFFFKKNKIFSPFVVFKKYSENGKYLNFSGKGYSISFDFEINKNKIKIEKFFNSLFLKNKLKVNFSKDLQK